MASASDWRSSWRRCWSRISRSNAATSSAMDDGPGGNVTSLAEQAPHLQQGRDEGFDFGVCVVEGQRRAAGRGYAEELHQRVRAVVSGADCHAFQVEQGGEVVGVRAFDQEADYRGLVR